MDPALRELINQLLRNGSLTTDDLAQIVERLNHEGETDAAYDVGVCLIEASRPTPSEEADAARSRFTVHDGGNSTA
jgi:hypothetical protein